MPYVLEARLVEVPDGLDDRRRNGFLRVQARGGYWARADLDDAAGIQDAATAIGTAIAARVEADGLPETPAAVRAAPPPPPPTGRALHRRAQARGL